MGIEDISDNEMRELYFRCSQPKEINKALNAVYKKLPKDLMQRVNRVFCEYLAHGGIEEAFAKFNDRSVAQVLAEYSPNGDVELIRSGQLDGMTFELYGSVANTSQHSPSKAEAVQERYEKSPQVDGPALAPESRLTEESCEIRVLRRLTFAGVEKKVAFLGFIDNEVKPAKYVVLQRDLEPPIAATDLPVDKVHMQVVEKMGCVDITSVSVRPDEIVFDLSEETSKKSGISGTVRVVFDDASDGGISENQKIIEQLQLLVGQAIVQIENT